jgi:predicted DNA-binding helix-hairpin-helix protein
MSETQLSIRADDDSDADVLAKGQRLHGQLTLSRLREVLAKVGLACSLTHPDRVCRLNSKRL